MTSTRSSSAGPKPAWLPSTESLQPSFPCTVVNEFISLWGLQSWKPVLTALALPPAPMIFGVLIGAKLLSTRTRWGWGLILLSTLCLWISSTMGWSDFLARHFLETPEPMSERRIAELRRAPGKTAIVVLGGGVEELAPEYGAANLTGTSLERLRYALRLSRTTQIPIAFSGGVGWAQGHGTPEAEVAARIAASEFGTPLKWAEATSRDTVENAAKTIPILKEDGIKRIILVTHGWHMPRAMTAFKRQAHGQMIVEAAPMGLGQRSTTPLMQWLPTGDGAIQSRRVTTELIGRLMGF